MVLWHAVRRIASSGACALFLALALQNPKLALLAIWGPLSVVFFVASWPLRFLGKQRASSLVEGAAFLLSSAVVAVVLVVVLEFHLSWAYRAAGLIWFGQLAIGGFLGLIRSKEWRAIEEKITAIQWAVSCVLVLLATTWSVSTSLSTKDPTVQVPSGLAIVAEIALFFWASTKLLPGKTTGLEEVTAWAIYLLGFILWAILFRLLQTGHETVYLTALASLVGPALIALVLEHGLRKERNPADD